MLTANSVAGTGKQESQEDENEGNLFCQPHLLEAALRGLKRIIEVGGLKMELKKRHKVHEDD